MRAVLLLALLAALVPAFPAASAPVAVRLPEGAARGFVAVRDLGGRPLGHGELHQQLAGRLVDSRLTLRFADGSLREEQTVFSQRGVFRLERYRLRQQGRSFPRAEVAFDRATGRYTAMAASKPGGTPERASGRLELPADLYTGLTTTLLRNATAPAELDVQTVVFTPAPRFLAMRVRREAEERATVAAAPVTAIRYLVTLDLGGLVGLVAPLLGKAPPDLRYWVIAGDIPVFARFEGPMYLNGPVWRVEQAVPRWPG